MPDSERFTRSTCCAWSSIDRLRCSTPMPPWRAIAIAIRASVTVSIALDTSGTASVDVAGQPGGGVDLARHDVGLGRQQQHVVEGQAERHARAAAVRRHGYVVHGDAAPLSAGGPSSYPSACVARLRRRSSAVRRYAAPAKPADAGLTWRGARRAHRPVRRRPGRPLRELADLDAEEPRRRAADRRPSARTCSRTSRTWRSTRRC